MVRLAGCFPGFPETKPREPTGSRKVDPREAGCPRSPLACHVNFRTCNAKCKKESKAIRTCDCFLGTIGHQPLTQAPGAVTWAIACQGRPHGVIVLVVRAQLSQCKQIKCKENAKAREQARFNTQGQRHTYSKACWVTAIEVNHQGGSADFIFSPSSAVTTSATTSSRTLTAPLPLRSLRTCGTHHTKKTSWLL